MKKLGILLSLVTLLVLASCGASNAPAVETVVTEVTTPEVEAIVAETSEELADVSEDIVEEAIEVIEESTDISEDSIEEVLSLEDAAAYEAEQAAAAEVQAALEAQLAETELVVMKSGTFVGIAPGHNSEGGVTIKDNGDSVIIELSSDFVADQGPDLYVTLSQEQALTGADPVQLDTSKILAATPLVSLNGVQSYEVSKADFDANNYAVVIWCKQFNVVFGAAILN